MKRIEKQHEKEIDGVVYVSWWWVYAHYNSDPRFNSKTFHRGQWFPKELVKLHFSAVAITKTTPKETEQLDFVDKGTAQRLSGYRGTDFLRWALTYKIRIAVGVDTAVFSYKDVLSNLDKKIPMRASGGRHRNIAGFNPVDFGNEGLVYYILEKNVETLIENGRFYYRH